MSIILDGTGSKVIARFGVAISELIYPKNLTLKMPKVDSTVAELVQHESDPWTGEGLPPVGLEVEAWYAMDTFPGWKHFKLKYFSKESVVFEGMHETYVSRGTFDRWDLRFRPILPIRTPEQIAAEERDKAANEMFNMPGCRISYTAALALYDAGYRKQVAM